MSVRQENRWRKRLQNEYSAINDIKRMIEAAHMPRSPRKPALKLPAAPSRATVRNWMRSNAAEYDGPTQLAEGANAALNLPLEWLDDETHWVWDEAANAMPD